MGLSCGSGCYAVQKIGGTLMYRAPVARPGQVTDCESLARIGRLFGEKKNLVIVQEIIMIDPGGGYEKSEYGIGW